MRSVSDVRDRLRTKSIAELSQVETRRRNGDPRRLEDSIRRDGRAAQGSSLDDRAAAADAPVLSPGRTLDQNKRCRDVPRYAPTERPALSRAVRAAIPEGN